MNGTGQLAKRALAGSGVASPGKELALTIPGPGKVQLRMKQIPAGTFVMGSRMAEKGRIGEEEPTHQVAISTSFFLGVYAVTLAQWEAVMGTYPAELKGNPANPVEQVCWEDCEEYLKKLNGMGIGTFRLPTEAEWEYACRAGTQTAYSFGDDVRKLREYAWYDGNSGNTVQQVGTKKPNPWGLYDMHGSVWEWCSDWYDDYNMAKQTDPKGAAGGPYRVFRGGSWSSLSEYCRSASRDRFWPSYRDEC